MIFGKDILSDLHDRLKQIDNAASSHWKYFHQFLEVGEDQSIKNTIGFGDGKRDYSPFTKPFHWFFQKRYHGFVPKSDFFDRAYAIAQGNCKRTSSRFSLDVLRQVLTLSRLHSNDLIKTNHRALVIGDGFGCMTSLLVQTDTAEKVVLVNLTKTLFVDTTYLLALPELQDKKSIALVKTATEIKSAMQNNFVKVVVVEAKDYEILHASEADLVFNIASMQEMDMKYVENYFQQMRLIAEKKPVYFYCCNREYKELPDGSPIAFDAYPWQDNDHHYFDELCPWHQDYYRLLPNFYFPYDGPIRHRFTKLSAWSLCLKSEKTPEPT